MPHEIAAGKIIPLRRGLSVSAISHNADDEFAAADLIDRLANRGIRARKDGGGTVRIDFVRRNTKQAITLLAHFHEQFDPAMRDEGYVLLCEGDRIYDIAATGTGIYYGAQTIAQLITGNGSTAVLHTAKVRDWPAMKYRGVSDDISRGPMPTLEFQKHQVRVFSQYKINFYSPYFESTLAYASNPLPALPGAAMTRADVEELVKYAARYHVSVIPQQEAFGHLHHMLMFDTYANVSETPEGSVLAPGQPGSLELIKQWFTEIASMFPSPFIGIGADETFDLGAGKTKAAVEREGLGKVYADFLTQIHNALEPLHKRILFAGDIAMKNPELVKTLPKDMIAVAWQYKVHPGGFDRWIRPFTDAGLETWVAPGVANWNLVSPNNVQALPDIQQFASDGQRLGATGLVNTVWYDDGEGLFNQTWYGILFGAAASWQPGTSNIAQFQNSYGQVFHGDWTGKINRAQIELMTADEILNQAHLGPSSTLFWIDPLSKDGQAISAKILPVVQEMREHTENAITLIEQARAAGPLRETDALDAMEMGARRMDFLGYKFEAAQNLIDEYNIAYREQGKSANTMDIARQLFLISGINGQCQDLRDGYGLTRDLYCNAWDQENRLYWRDTILEYYDISIQLWIKRGWRFMEIRQEWQKTGHLPKPENVGLPSTTAPDAVAP